MVLFRFWFYVMSDCCNTKIFRLFLCVYIKFNFQTIDFAKNLTKLIMCALAWMLFERERINCLNKRIHMWWLMLLFVMRWRAAMFLELGSRGCALDIGVATTGLLYDCSFEVNKRVWFAVCRYSVREQGVCFLGILHHLLHCSTK